jgi:hypothetical protein
MSKFSFIHGCALVALMAIGCHKSPVSVEQTPPPADAVAAAAPSADSPGQAGLPPPPMPSASVLARSENNLRENAAGEVNAFMTRQLRLFVQQTGRLPQTFAEFASRRLDGVPPPPEGTKWVIDGATQEVKAVGLSK